MIRQWGSTLHPELAAEIVRRWNLYVPMQTEITKLMAEIERLKAKRKKSKRKKRK